MTRNIENNSTHDPDYARPTKSHSPQPTIWQKLRHPYENEKKEHHTVASNQRSASKVSRERHTLQFLGCPPPPPPKRNQMLVRISLQGLPSFPANRPKVRILSCRAASNMTIREVPFPEVAPRSPHTTAQIACVRACE